MKTIIGFRVCLFPFFALLFSATANAETCSASDGAGLQSCLVTTAPGDTILLDPGIYIPTTELVFPEPRGRTFFIGKSLTIKGSRPGVILSGDLGALKAFNVVTIDTAAAPGPVNIENLTIRDGDSSGGGFFTGGGIIAGPNQTVTLDSVAVEDNTAGLGGGIWTGEGDLSTWTITNSRFAGNTATFENGGAIRAGGTDVLVIDSSEFNGNSAPLGFGGAVHYQAFGMLQISNSRFTNNIADVGGGAVAIQGIGPFRSYLIQNCEFGDNAATYIGAGGGFGGAIDIFSTVGPGQISGSSFYRNSATFGGGAVYFQWGRAVIDKNDFWENYAGVFGGAIAIEGDPTEVYTTNITLEKNQFSYNTAEISGGAVAAADIDDKPESGLTFSKNRYDRNSAEMNGAVGIGAFAGTGGNLVMFKEHFNHNWAGNMAGALGILGVVSGRIDKLYFNQNEASESVDSLYIENSVDLETGKIQVAGEDSDDCSIEGSPICP